MKIDQNRLERGGAGKQRAYFVAESQRVGKEQRSIQAQDLQARNGGPFGRLPDLAVSMLLARYGAQAGDGEMTGTPNEPKQREHYCNTQAGQYPEGNNSEQGPHGLRELTSMKSVKALQFTDLHHPHHCMDDDYP